MTLSRTLTHFLFPFHFLLFVSVVDPNNNNNHQNQQHQSLNNNHNQYLDLLQFQQQPPHQPGSSNGVSGVLTASHQHHGSVYKPVPPPKPLSSPPTYRMPPPPTGGAASSALYMDQPPIPGATCSSYEMQAQNLRTHSAKFPVSEDTGEINQLERRLIVGGSRGPLSLLPNFWQTMWLLITIEHGGSHYVPQQEVVKV